jgi:hypothetical protein
VRPGPANLAFSQPWGTWGYLGAAAAEQYGFRFPGSALSALGIDVTPSDTDPPSAPRSCNVAVRQYRTGYAKELSKLPALLKTTATASPFPSARPTRTGLLFGL